ncbi:SH3 beta-barrel fold-containing protein [Bacteroides thetaiotaomicron]|nr:SH3 beta-barrel fold-containing protein [Bacteroides thetaiotaomicron]
MTKEKRLIATNKTEEERDRLTEVWKKRIVSEKGYSETIAERIAEKVKSLADYMQYGHAIIAYYRQNGSFQLVTGTLISYSKDFHHSYDMKQVHSTFIFGAWKRKDGEPFRLRIFSIGNQLYKLKNKQ